MKWLLPLLVACGGNGRMTDIDVHDANNIDAPVHCNPVTQTICREQKCAWLVDQVNPFIGHTGCAPVGTAQVGEPCSFGAAGPEGFSTCVKGAECVGGRCAQICDDQHPCDPFHMCGPRTEVFDGAYGVCGA